MLMCVCQVVWLMNIMKELCNKENELVTLMINKVSTINLYKDPIPHGRRKYIDRIFHFSRELMCEGKLKLVY